MCSIVDANVAHEVFGSNRPPAGREFFNWLVKGQGRMVAGGKLLTELNKTAAGGWAREALNLGLIKEVKGDEVDSRTDELVRQGSCESDDPHVIALAQVSGARLLYSNDTDLHKDFGDKSLIDRPRGRVYSTRETKEFTTVHRNLLQRKDLCATSR